MQVNYHAPNNNMWSNTLSQIPRVYPPVTTHPNQSCWYIIATAQLNSTQSWVSLIFLRKPQTTPQNHTTNHKPKPSVTFSQLLHNQTRPNSVFNLISTIRFMPKIGPCPTPTKNKKNTQILIWANYKKLIHNPMVPYRTLQDHRPYRTLGGPKGPYGIIRDHTGLYRTLWGSTWPLGALGSSTGH